MSVEIRIADPPLALTDAEREHILAEAAGCGADRAEVALSGDGSELEVRYVRSVPRFERIRRITGYLVGTVDRWNDAKRAELWDRVRHNSPQDRRNAIANPLQIASTGSDGEMHPPAGKTRQNANLETQP